MYRVGWYDHIESNDLMLKYVMLTVMICYMDLHDSTMVMYTEFNAVLKFGCSGCALMLYLVPGPGPGLRSIYVMSIGIG